MQLLKQWAIALGFSTEPALQGVWERTGDHFAGCRIEIRSEGPQWRGTLIQILEKMEKFGWRTGDEKWIDIERHAVGRYTLRDLYKVLNTNTGGVSEFYRETLLDFVSDDEISVSPELKEDEPRSQTWRRIGNV